MRKPEADLWFGGGIRLFAGDSVLFNLWFGMSIGEGIHLHGSGFSLIAIISGYLQRGKLFCCE